MQAIFFLGGGEIFVMLFGLFVLFFLLLTTAFWIWMLVDCLKNERYVGNEKIIWVLVIALTHWLGALIYYFVGRKGAAVAAKT